MCCVCSAWLTLCAVLFSPQFFQRTKIKIAKHNCCERALLSHAAGLFEIFDIVDDPSMPKWPSPFEKPAETELAPLSVVVSAFIAEGAGTQNNVPVMPPMQSNVPAMPPTFSRPMAFGDLPVATAVPIPSGFDASAPVGMQMFQAPPPPAYVPPPAASLPFAPASPDVLSAYEVRRNCNVASNAAVLASLGLGDANSQGPGDKPVRAPACAARSRGRPRRTLECSTRMLV